MLDRRDAFWSFIYFEFRCTVDVRFINRGLVGFWGFWSFIVVVVRGVSEVGQVVSGFLGEIEFWSQQFESLVQSLSFCFRRGLCSYFFFYQVFFGVCSVQYLGSVFGFEFIGQFIGSLRGFFSQSWVDFRYSSWNCGKIGRWQLVVVVLVRRGFVFRGWVVFLDLRDVQDLEDLV